MADILQAGGVKSVDERMRPYLRKNEYHTESNENRSTRFPSIDSAYSGLKSLSPLSNAFSPDDEKSISFSDFLFDESSGFRSAEKKTTRAELCKDGMLTKKDVQEIEKKVEEEFGEDFKKIWREAKHKENKIRKGFKKVIDEARETLIQARVDAEKQAINKLEERAEEKQTEILHKRAMRKWTILRKELYEERDIPEHNFGAGEKWVKEQIQEMASLRKIQSDLDRARVRRKATSGAVVIRSKKGKVNKLLSTEIRKLEKIDEIQNLIQDLNDLGLHTHASTLRLSVNYKEHADVLLRRKLKDERSKARIAALTKKEKEVERLRKERIAEMERLEQERKAKEEKEKHACIMAALARKAHNQALRKSFNQSLLASKISRSQTFSYFPPPSLTKRK